VLLFVLWLFGVVAVVWWGGDVVVGVDVRKRARATPSTFGSLNA